MELDVQKTGAIQLHQLKSVCSQALENEGKRKREVLGTRAVAL